MNSILYTAGFSELFDTAHESPELDRVLDNMRRHMRTRSVRPGPGPAQYRAVRR
jgi:hypothetical protein